MEGWPRCPTNTAWCSRPPVPAVAPQRSAGPSSPTPCARPTLLRWTPGSRACCGNQACERLRQSHDLAEPVPPPVGKAVARFLGLVKIRRVVPLGRWQEPEDIAAMAIFLASELAKNVTGQTVNVDGGFVMH